MTSLHKSQPEFYQATLVRLSCENVHKYGAYLKRRARSEFRVGQAQCSFLQYTTTSSTRLYYSITSKKWESQSALLQYEKGRRSGAESYRPAKIVTASPVKGSFSKLSQVAIDSVCNGSTINKQVHIQQRASKVYLLMEHCVTKWFGMKIQIILVGIPIIFFCICFHLQVEQNSSHPHAGYSDRLGSSVKFVENYTKITCLELTIYRIKYSSVLWLLELQNRRGRKVQTQVHTVNSNSRTLNCQCSLFAKQNLIIQIFCICGWLAVQINSDKWSSTVLRNIHYG